jgi:arabinofuranosyltransferase
VTRALCHRRAYYLLVACLLICHALLYTYLLGFDVVDDAYISFRYAYNASRGYGLTFNVGERRVEGYTNFLWTVLFIPLLWLKLPPNVTAIGLGLVWALGCVALLWRAGRRELREGWLTLIASLLLAVDGSFALWAVGGMESALFAFLVLGGALAYLREMQDPHALPLSGAWFALAALTRPEGALVFALTSVHQVGTRLLTAPHGRGLRLASRQDWQRLGLFLLIWLPWFAFRWRYYGFLLPNTFYAKVTLTGSGAQRERGWAYVQTWIGVHLGYLPLLIALLSLLRRRWRLWSSYCLLVMVAYTAYIGYVGGDWSVGRFFVPLAPFYYLLLAGGLIVAGTWLASWVRQRIRVPSWVPLGLAIIAVAGLCTGLFVASSWNGEKALFLDPFDARLAGMARTEMGKWLYANALRDTYIAVDAAGQMPFYSDLRALDLFGLNDLTIAHRQVAEMGQGTPGHEKMDMNYVIFVAKPDYIIIYGTAFDWLSAYSYQRVDLPWTSDPQLKAFLGVYRRQ